MHVDSLPMGRFWKQDGKTPEEVRREDRHILNSTRVGMTEGIEEICVKLGVGWGGRGERR